MEAPKIYLNLEILVNDRHITIPIRESVLYDRLSCIQGPVDAKIWLTGAFDLKTEQEYQEFKEAFKQQKNNHE